MRSPAWPACLALFATLACVSAPAAFQGNARRPAPGDPDVLAAAVATFEGVIRVVDKKKLLFEVAEDQSLTLTVNKKTVFLDPAGKRVKASQVKPGTRASVDVHKVMGQMIALNVRLRKESD